MEKVLQASEANRQFSRILREVGQGASFIFASHGRAVARIVPAEPTPDRAAAWQTLLARPRSQPARNLGPFDRDEAYE